LECTSGGAAVRVWDVATGAELLTLADDGRLAMAVTGDGRHLYASHPRDGVVRVYTLPLEDTIALANERLTRTMTAAECQQYLHLDNCPDPLPIEQMHFYRLGKETAEVAGGGGFPRTVWTAV
jgi:hypothetical protein